MSDPRDMRNWKARQIIGHWFIPFPCGWLYTHPEVRFALVEIGWPPCVRGSDILKQLYPCKLFRLRLRDLCGYLAHERFTLAPVGTERHYTSPAAVQRLRPYDAAPKLPG